MLPPPQIDDQEIASPGGQQPAATVALPGLTPVAKPAALPGLTPVAKAPTTPAASDKPALPGLVEKTQEQKAKERQATFDGLLGAISVTHPLEAKAIRASVLKGGAPIDGVIDALTPIAGSIVGTATIGPGLGTKTGGMVGGALSDLLTQLRQYERGEIDHIHVGELGAMTALGGFVPKAIKPGPGMVLRTVRARSLQGAALAAGADAVTQAVDKKGTIDFKEILEQGAWGTAFGATFGVLEAAGPTALRWGKNLLEKITGNTVDEATKMLAKVVAEAPNPEQKAAAAALLEKLSKAAPAELDKIAPPYNEAKEGKINLLPEQPKSDADLLRAAKNPQPLAASTEKPIAQNPEPPTGESANATNTGLKQEVGGNEHQGNGAGGAPAESGGGGSPVNGEEGVPQVPREPAPPAATAPTENLTQEVRSTQTEAGKKIEELRAQHPDNEEQARDIERRAFFRLTAGGADSPLSKMLRAFGAPAGHVAEATPAFGTFGTKVSDHLRININEVPEQNKDALIAFLGKVFHQDAGASSLFQPAHGALPPEGFNRTATVTATNITNAEDEGIRKLAANYSKAGFECNITNAADGRVVLELHPNYNGERPVGITQEVAADTARRVLGAKNFHVDIVDSKPHYVTSGAYEDKLAEYQKRLAENAPGEPAGGVVGGQGSAEGPAGGGAPGQAGPGGGNDAGTAEAARPRQAEGLHQLADAEAAAGEVNSQLEQDRRDAVPQMEQRIADAKAAEAADVPPAAAEAEAAAGKEVKPRFPLSPAKPGSGYPYVDLKGRPVKFDDDRGEYVFALPGHKANVLAGAAAFANRQVLSTMAGGAAGATYGWETGDDTQDKITRAFIMGSAGAYAGHKGMAFADDVQTFRNLKAIAGDRVKIAQFLAKGAIKEAMVWTRDAADNKAGNFASNQANVIANMISRSFDKGDTQRVRTALTFFREANGDAQVLHEFENTIRESKLVRPQVKEEALDGIHDALEYSEVLKPIADQYAGITDGEINSEHEAGIETPYFGKNGYVMHAQDIDTSLGHLFTEGGGSDIMGFNKIREHPTYADSIAAGVVPKTLDAVDLLQARLQHGQQIINRNAWLDGLKTITDPMSGKPIADKLEATTRANGAVQLTPPRGYTVERLGGRAVAVMNGYEGVFNSLTNPSWFNSAPELRALQNVNAAGKSAMLMIDTFHLGRLAYWESVAKAAGVKTFELPLPSYRKGLVLLDQTPGEIAKMASEENWSQTKLAQAIEGKRIVQMGLDTGANFGRVSDALHEDFIRNIPVVGPVNKFIFDKFQRGAMAEVYRMEFNRQRAMFPELNEMQVARQVSKDVNTRFGNLGRQGIFTSQTAQDVARLFVLAPQWNEGLIRSEAGAVTQGLSAAGRMFAGEQLASGLLFRSVAVSALSMFAANQIINQYTRGKWTWENPEEGVGAKLSAWIPDKIGGGPGFFLHPLGIGAEITHLLMTRYEKTQNARETFIDMGRSRASAVARPLLTFALGKSGFGGNIRPDDIWAETGKSAIPLPIPSRAAYGAYRQLSTGQPSEPYVGAWQRQFMQSFGLKTDQVPAPYQRIAALVKSYHEAHGTRPDAEFYAGDFQKLTTALRLGNRNDINAEMKDLMVQKTPDAIAQHYERQVYAPATGARKQEKDFISTLSDEQKQTYEKMNADKTVLRDKAFTALSGYMKANNIEGAKDAEERMSPGYQRAAQAVHEQSAEQADRRDEAIDHLKAIQTTQPGTPERKAKVDEVKKDPLLYKAMETEFRRQQRDLSITERHIEELSETSGARAKFILDEIKRLPPEQRNGYAQTLRDKKILTPPVESQISQIMRTDRLSRTPAPEYEAQIDRLMKP